MNDAIPKADEQEKWQLPAELLTPERLEAAEREQRELASRINSPFAHKTPQDIQRFNAGIITQEIEQYLKTVSIEQVPPIIRDQYAEALGELGYFQKAADWCVSEVHKEQYQAFADAVWLADDKTCKCQPENGLNNLYAECQVFSLKHNRVMSVVKCKCGFRNVRNLPESIRKEREIRKRNLALVTGKTKEEARQVLMRLQNIK